MGEVDGHPRGFFEGPANKKHPGARFSRAGRRLSPSLPRSRRPAHAHNRPGLPTHGTADTSGIGRRVEGWADLRPNAHLERRDKTWGERESARPRKRKSGFGGWAMRPLLIPSLRVFLSPPTLCLLSLYSITRSPQRPRPPPLYSSLLISAPRPPPPPLLAVRPPTAIPGQPACPRPRPPRRPAGRPAGRRPRSASAARPGRPRP